MSEWSHEVPRYLVKHYYRCFFYISQSSVQSISHVWLFVTPWTTARQASLSITNSWSLLKLMSIELVMPSSHLILHCPLLLLPSIFPSFASGGQSIGASVSASILPVNIYNWFSLGWTEWISLQSKGLSRVFSNATVQKCSAFFIVQLSHPYMTTGKTIALTRQTFVGKVMSLLFNMLSRLLIAFLSKSKCLLISWLESPSYFGAQNNKVCHCFHFFPIYLPWTYGTRCHDLSFLNVEFSANFFTLLFHFYQEAL